MTVKSLLIFVSLITRYERFKLNLLDSEVGLNECATMDSLSSDDKKMGVGGLYVDQVEVQIKSMASAIDDAPIKIL